jgi:hypothetical protein
MLYFFDIDNNGLFRDEAGTELDSDDLAVAEGGYVLSEVMRDEFVASEGARLFSCHIRRSGQEPFLALTVALEVHRLLPASVSSRQ